MTMETATHNDFLSTIADPVETELQRGTPLQEKQEVNTRLCREVRPYLFRTIRVIRLSTESIRIQIDPFVEEQKAIVRRANRIR